MTIFYQTDHTSLSYDQSRKLGRATRTGFLSGAEYRESAYKTIEMLNQFGLTKYLSDTRHMKAIRQKDQEWTVKELTPLLMNTPVRRIANLVSEDIFNKMAVTQIIKRISPQPGLEIRQFMDEEEAMAWLEEEE